MAPLTVRSRHDGSGPLFLIGFAVGVILCISVLSPGRAANATGNETDAIEGSEPEDRNVHWSWRGWTPSFSFALGFVSMTGEGDGGIADSSGDEFRPPYSGESRLTSPLGRVSLELRSPDMNFIPTSPSVFASADYVGMFSPTQKIAGVGEAERLEIPGNGLNLPEDVISGQGRRLDVEVDDHALGATLGLSIPFEVLGRRMRVMPGVSYMRQVIVVKGRVLDAYKPSSLGREFRTILLTGDEKLRLNGIGPSLALEFDAGRVGTVWLSIFMDAAGFRSIGNRTVEFENERTYTDFIGTETYSSRWRYEADEWFYRVNAGVRFYLAEDQ